MYLKSIHAFFTCITIAVTAQAADASAVRHSYLVNRAHAYETSR